ncbi:hypothetical protein ACLBWZ_08920 [Brucellaceae bacterium C25G]
MAKFNYGRSRDTALRLITKFGAKATLTRIDGGDPNDWQSSGGDKSVYEVTVAMLPVGASKADNFDLKFDANFIMQQARFGYMAVQMKKISGSGSDRIQPQPTDIINVNGEELTVLGSRDLNPAGTQVYYAFAAKA